MSVVSQERWQVFLDRVVPVTESGCWLWLGAAGRGKDQYGYFWTGPKTKYARAYRVAYEMLVGPVPSGMSLDHLCRVHCCVNPAHLEPVTARENTMRGMGLPAQNARKTHCLKGHAYDSVNTRAKPTGGRYCRACERERMRLTYRRKAAEATLRALEERT